MSNYTEEKAALDYCLEAMDICTQILDKGDVKIKKGHTDAYYQDYEVYTDGRQIFTIRRQSMKDMWTGVLSSPRYEFYPKGEVSSALEAVQGSRISFRAEKMFEKVEKMYREQEHKKYEEAQQKVYDKYKPDLDDLRSLLPTNRNIDFNM